MLGASFRFHRMSQIDSMERSSLLRNTLLGLVASLFLSGIKFLAGVVGHSSALVADAVESFADAIGSLLVWQALRVASRPADEKHPYGYGKAEAIGALAVGCLLVIAALWIAWESIRTWAGEPSSPEPWTLLVLLLVIGVKELLFRRLAEGAKEEQSSAAHADAWHHRADAISSLAALVGVAIAVWGPKWTGQAWLAAADEWAALVAAAIILGTAWSILMPALRELLDADEPEMAEQVRKVAEQVEGVREVEKLHVRKSGAGFYADLHLHVPADLSVDQAHRLGGKVKALLLKEIPALRQVLIHIEPADERTA